MDFDFSYILKTFLDGIGRRINNLFSWINSYYTPLSVIAISIVGGILIIVSCYITRYSFYNYWNWKQRAFKKIIFFIVTLVLIRILIRRMA